MTARATVPTAGEGDLEPFEGETTERVNCNEKYVPWSARFENAACGTRIGNKAMTAAKHHPCEVVARAGANMIVRFPNVGKVRKRKIRELIPYDI